MKTKKLARKYEAIIIDEIVSQYDKKGTISQDQS
jgi:hypothetical protein